MVSFHYKQTSFSAYEADLGVYTYPVVRSVANQVITR